MQTIVLSQYAPIITDSELSEQIFEDIQAAFKKSPSIIIDFEGVLSMATFCSKQIFGRLYVEMGSGNFFDRIIMRNASSDMRIIVRLGIEKALEDNPNFPVVKK